MDINPVSNTKLAIGILVTIYRKGVGPQRLDWCDQDYMSVSEGLT